MMFVYDVFGIKVGCEKIELMLKLVDVFNCKRQAYNYHYNLKVISYVINGDTITITFDKCARQLTEKINESKTHYATVSDETSKTITVGKIHA